MSKKKREHVTFDRMPDERVAVNKKAFLKAQAQRAKTVTPATKGKKQDSPASPGPA